MATLWQQGATGEDGHIRAAKRNRRRWPHYAATLLQQGGTGEDGHITAGRRNRRRRPRTHYVTTLRQQEGIGEDGRIMATKRNWRRWPHYAATLRQQGGTREDGHLTVARRNWKRRPHSPCRLNFVCSIDLQLVEDEEEKTLTDKQLLVHRDSPRCLISTLGSSPNPSFFPNSSAATTSVETCTHGTMAMCVTTATPGHLY